MLQPTNKPSLGIIFRQKREEKGLLIRQVASVTELDQAIVSRIENCDRLPTREQVIKFAGLYGLDIRETVSTWLAEKMVRDYGEEPYAPEAFRDAHDQVILKHSRSMAEDRILYNISPRNSPAFNDPNENKPSKRGRKPKNPGI